MIINFRSKTLTLQDLVFKETAGLLQTSKASIRDPFFGIGQHCSVRVVITARTDQRFNVQVSLQAFHPELVDWSGLRVALRSDERTVDQVLRPTPQGIARTASKADSCSLAAFTGAYPLKDDERSGEEPGGGSKYQLTKQMSRLAAQTEKNEGKDIGNHIEKVRRVHIPDSDLDLFMDREGSRTVFVVIGKMDVEHEHLDRMSIVIYFLDQESNDLIETIQFPIIKVSKIALGIQQRFNIETEPGKRYWFGYWDAQLSLRKDCFVEPNLVLKKE